MKSVFLFLTLLWSVLLHAQDRELEKIQKHYSLGKYEKVVKLCDKALVSTEHRRNPGFYYYKSLCVYKQADTSSPTYYKTIVSAVNVAAKGVLYDKQHLLFNKQNAEFKSMLDEAHHQAEVRYYTNKVKEAKTLEGTIARSFKDTSELYLVLFAVAPKTIVEEKPIVIELKENAIKVDSLVYFASTQLGKEYKYGKEGPDAFDCSGFIGYVFKHYGEKLPHNANMISKMGEEVNAENIKKGDLIFFGTTRAYHVAMYVADKGETPKIIHCVSRGVCIDDFGDGTHWGKSNVYKIKRVVK